MQTWFKKYEGYIILVLLLWLCLKSCMLNRNVNDLNDTVNRRFNRTDSVNNVIVNHQISVNDIKIENIELIKSFLSIKGLKDDARFSNEVDKLNKAINNNKSDTNKIKNSKQK